MSDLQESPIIGVCVHCRCWIREAHLQAGQARVVNSDPEGGKAYEHVDRCPSSLVTE